MAPFVGWSSKSETTPQSGVYPTCHPPLALSETLA